MLPPAATVSIEEAATLLRCSPDTILGALRDGTLPGLKFSRDWIIPAEAFMKRLTELSLEQAVERRNSKEVPTPKPIQGVGRRKPLLSLPHPVR